MKAQRQERSSVRSRKSPAVTLIGRISLRGAHWRSTRSAHTCHFQQPSSPCRAPGAAVDLRRRRRRFSRASRIKTKCLWPIGPSRRIRVRSFGSTYMGVPLLISESQCMIATTLPHKYSVIACPLPNTQTPTSRKSTIRRFCGYEIIFLVLENRERSSTQPLLPRGNYLMRYATTEPPTSAYTPPGRFL